MAMTDMLQAPISETNTELGKTATVTFEGTMSPATADMDVTWTIESDEGVYKKRREQRTPLGGQSLHLH